MKRLAFLLLILLTSVACSQMLSGAKTVATPMADSAGKPLSMDFKIELTGIKDANMPFSVFSSKPLMLYYFSPFCPHCQRSYPNIQKVAKEFEQKGLSSIAVSVGSVSKRDILMFMEQQNASIPFFQDAKQDFGKKYGDGYVPRLYLIYPDGKVFRYTALENENMADIKADIEKMLK